MTVTSLLTIPCINLPLSVDAHRAVIYFNPLWYFKWAVVILQLIEWNLHWSYQWSSAVADWTFAPDVSASAGMQCCVICKLTGSGSYQLVKVVKMLYVWMEVCRPVQLSCLKSIEDGLHNNADETLRRAVRWSTDIVALYLHWHGIIRGSLSLQL